MEFERTKVAQFQDQECKLTLRDALAEFYSVNSHILSKPKPKTMVSLRPCINPFASNIYMVFAHLYLVNRNNTYAFHNVFSLIFVFGSLAPVHSISSILLNPQNI